MRRILNGIQDRWSSPDPQDRTIGAIGKYLWEGFTALIVTGVLISPIFAIDIYIVEVNTLFATYAPEGIAIATLLFFARQFFCSIILDLREIDAETGETPSE